jgi:RNA polymerase sigma factor (sigma-70 family)
MVAVMPAGRQTLLHHIRRLAVPAITDDLCDAALLERFLAQKDEIAFATLVNRHGPMVSQVCRRVLAHADDAEDAFQAVFMVLARKAATVHPRHALPAWLHGVAFRVALNARSIRSRRLGRARGLPGVMADPRPDPLAELSARELLDILDDEIRQLPQRYRLPVILCCLQGRSQEEAARQLGWSPGSVKGRLERGRARLQKRFVRRGLTLSAALAAAELSRAVAVPALAAALVARTLQGATVFGSPQTAAFAGLSAEAAGLAEATLRGMALAKLKILAVLALATCLLTAELVIYGAGRRSFAPTPLMSSPVPGLKTGGATAENPVFEPEISLGPATLVNIRRAEPRDEASFSTDVRGRVFDPEGRPFAGAKLYLGYSARRYVRDNLRPPADRPRATSDARGWFHFAFAPAELDAKWLDDSWPAVLAAADGYGPAWVEVRESGKGTELSLKLVEDSSINGRIVDPNRQPVAGATLRVQNVYSDSKEGVARALRGDFNSWYPRTWRGAVPGQPPRVTTDADGRFRLTGLGRHRVAALALEGPAIQHTFLTVAAQSATMPSDGVSGTTFEHVALASRPIRGVVRDQTNGKPLSGVRISASETISTTLTNDDGAYELLGCSKSRGGYRIMAQPQADQPYFAATVWKPDGPGLDPIAANFELQSGVVLQGRVTDQVTHKPPRTAVVEYAPLFPNIHSSRIICNGCSMAASSAVIQPDGCYRLVVLPGPGVVCVAASPRGAYAEAFVDEPGLASLFHDGLNHGDGQRLLTAIAGTQSKLWVNKYNALSLINPEPNAGPLLLDLTVQPAQRLQGFVIGPDGKPLTGVNVAGLTAMPDDELLETPSFNVTGLNPRHTRTLVFHHTRKGLGKVLTVRGDETKALTVQLDPCGSALGRLVDQRGKPVPELEVGFVRGTNGPAILAKTDRDGRFCVSLVPLQRYSLRPSSSGRLLRDVGEVAVESGHSKDLGELTMAD